MGIANTDTDEFKILDLRVKEINLQVSCSTEDAVVLGDVLPLEATDTFVNDLLKKAKIVKKHIIDICQ